MIKIAICDDDIKILTKIEELIIHNLKEHNYKIDKFDNTQDLENQFITTGYDILFLDIEIGNNNGIDFAIKLRNQSFRGLIIFITSFIDYALSGYKVNAFRYILKSDLENKLNECLTEIDNSITFKKITLSNLDIQLRDISYLESMNHQVIIHLKNRESLSIYSSLSKLKQILNYKEFYQVHRSFVVNMEEVKAVKNRHLLLNDDSKVPIAQEKYAEIKKIFVLGKRLWS